MIQRHIRVVNVNENKSFIDNIKSRKQLSVSYSRDGLLVNGIEYPTPTGVYLFKLLETSINTKESSSTVKQLIQILIERKSGTLHTKELSESMAMVNAINKVQIYNISYPFNLITLKLQNTMGL